VWQILIGSLALDPLIPLFITPEIPVDMAVLVATLCAIVALPFLAQRSMHRILSQLRRLHSQSLTIGSKALPVSLALSALAVILLKVLYVLAPSSGDLNRYHRGHVVGESKIDHSR